MKYFILTLCFFSLSAHYEQDVTAYLENSWCSKEKSELIMNAVKELHPKVCVEIGACSGSSMLPFAATLKHLGSGHIYAIDAWSNAEAIRHLPQTDPNTEWWGKVDMLALKKQCEKTIKQFSLQPYVTLVHASSKDVSDQFVAIDFLHIDGSFSEVGSLEDLREYLPRVRSGGYILLSNVLITIGGELTKMPTLWELYESAELIAEVEHFNTLLFKKM